MEARILRMQQEKLQRVRLLQREVFATPPMPVGISAYPPIFLSPSSFDPFTPSPSPLPVAGAAAGSSQSVPKAAIIGGSIAGVVALAVTATIISTVAGKVGAGCLLGPACKLFSCLFENLLAPCAGKLNSLCSTLKNWNPARKAASKKAASDGDDGADDPDMDLYKILGGSPNAVTKAESAAAAARDSLAKSPLRDVLKGHGDQLGTSAHAFLATGVSDFAESELKKQKAMMMQPVNQNIAKAEGYAQSLIFSVTDNVNADLRALKQSADAHLIEVSKLKAHADHDMKTSMEAIGAVWKQPEHAVLSILDDAVRVGAEKMKNTIAHEQAAGMKKLQKLQEAVTLEEEVVLQRMLGKPPRTSSKEAHELEEEEAKQQVILGRNEMEATSYAQVPHKDIEIGEAAATHHNSAGTTSMALIPTDPGGNVTNSPAIGGAIVPVPSKAIATTTSPSKAKLWAHASEDEVKGKQIIAAKAKRPSNLGHVSFTCEMSAHRLRFFTSCRSGGTYGSPPPSPSPSLHHPNNHNHYPRTIIKGSDDYSSNYQPPCGHYYTAPLYTGVQLAPTRNHFSLMHQQYHPSQPILAQSNSVAPPLTQHTGRVATPIEMLVYKPHSESPSQLDYGSPFDGVL